jgi:hypothetical protein
MISRAQPKGARERAHQVLINPTTAERGFLNFQISPEQCNWAKTNSKMFCMQTSCSHQFISTQSRINTCSAINHGPEAPKSKDQLHLTKVVLTRSGRAPNEQRVKKLREFGGRAIKRFSHTMGNEKLRQFVDDHFVIGDAIAFGTPMSTSDLISVWTKELPRKCK